MGNKGKLNPALIRGKRKIGEYMKLHNLPGAEAYFDDADMLDNLKANARKKFVREHGSVKAGCTAMQHR